MMLRSAPAVFLVVLCLLVLPAVASAQQPAVPAGAVAIVGDQPVTKKAFSHWLRAALHSYGPKAVFDPPSFRRCAASDRRRVRKGKPKPSLGSLRRRCARRYKAARRDVMQFLIQGLWIRREAAARGIVVTPAEVRRDFEEQRRIAFPEKGGYRKFIRESGMTTGDILFRVKLDLLQTRITEQVANTVAIPTDAEIDAYHQRHKRDFGDSLSAKERRLIRDKLISEREQDALDPFIKDFHARSRAATTCATGYIVAECGNR